MPVEKEFQELWFKFKQLEADQQMEIISKLESQINKEPELHYFTFGMKQLYAGHVQPILANNFGQAKKAMIHTFGFNNYARSRHYSQQEWRKIKRPEKVLELIDARKFGR